jgi:hypothetical protein
MKRWWLFLLTLGLLRADGQFSVDQYREVSGRLIGAALTDETGIGRLEYLCDRIGNRLSGSPALERAIAWSAAEMKRAGLENVRTIPVKVPHWVRGKESLAMIEPVGRAIPMLGLGSSVSTPAGGIEADVVAVSSFPELAVLGREKIAGKIVLYDEPYRGYGDTVMYRTSGAAQAARWGAVAALVRSVASASLRSPHTGDSGYEAGGAQIPSAAVSTEDADAMARLVRSGVRVRVRLSMEAHTEPPADSFDVMGEIPGREKPNEVVVLGGHIDSWDVGQGAHDDGAGIMASLAAVALMKQLNLRPRRTVRVVFWTNEENGTAGGRAYRQWLGDAVKDHVAAIEMDGGSEKPVGFGFGPEPGRSRAVPPGAAPRAAAPGPEVSPAAFDRVAAIGKLLDSIDAGQITRGGEGADIQALLISGVPGFGLGTVGTHYFDWHHSEADTFDKVDPHDFKLNVAALAVLSYVLADMPERLTDLK